MRSRRSVLSSLLGVALAPVALIGSAQAQQWRPPSMRSSAPPISQPPAPRHETRPPPRAGYVWVPGHWEWSARQRHHVWVAGRWERNRPGFHYRGPRWVHRRGEWVFVPGAWVR